MIQNDFILFTCVVIERENLRRLLHNNKISLFCVTENNNVGNMWYFLTKLIYSIDDSFENIYRYWTLY